MYFNFYENYNFTMLFYNSKSNDAHSLLPGNYDLIPRGVSVPI